MALLAQVPRPPTKRPDLEQVRTPPEVAADLVLAADRHAPLAGRRVVDLGAGTGMFSVAAAALGAQVTGVEIDPAAAEVARVTLRTLVPDAAAHIVVADVADAVSSADVVLMNPPFGAQKGNRHADRPFHATAMRLAPSIWFLALTSTERFLARTYAAYALERVAAWDYPLEASFAFHQEVARTLPVGGYHAARTTALK